MNYFKTNFLSRDEAKRLAVKHATPLFIYSKEKLIKQAKTMLEVPAPYGLTVRYAMKANPYPGILRVLREQGIKIDASSGYEAEAAMKSGFKPSDILLTSQQLPKNIKALAGKGVQFNATSLHQLEEYGRTAPGTSVSIRLNPGVGSGHSTKTTTGGLNSSFGVWHEYIPQILETAKRHGLKIKRVHTHIGSGTDPEVWQDAARTSIEHLKYFTDATTLDLGGGFKVARMDDEQGTDISKVCKVIFKVLEDFHEQTGRELRLELEPGTFLVANAGILLSRIEDIVDTGANGHNFIKLDTGMNDILRPSLYGAQHPIAVLNGSNRAVDYIVVGHNCESGDLLTPESGAPETLASRTLNKAAIGDLVLIGGAGAYCASMAAQGYNSYPITEEVII